MNDKQPPADPAAERAVLGSLLADPAIIERVCMLLAAGDFSDPRNALLYGAIMTLHGKRVAPNVIALASELRRAGRLEDAGGTAYLGELFERGFSPALAEGYAARVKDAALKRSLINLGGRIAGMGYQDADEAPGLVKEAQALLLGLSTRTVGGGLTSLQGRLLDRLAELRDLRDQLRRDERTVPGVSTGFRDLDRVTGGYQDGDLIIFAALTGAGKTSLGADALYAASFNGVKSLIFSAEMTRRQLEDRALATHARLDLRRLRGAQFDDGEESRLFDAIGRLGSGADILIDDTRDLPVWELCNRARYEAHKERVGLVVVDYLQLLEGERRRGDLRSAEVGSISRALKGLAGELGAPVIALSQLNRQVYNREDKTPLLSDLYESGRIAQDADMVIFIHQPSFFDEDADPNVAQLYVEKNRHGPTCMIPVRWTPEYTTFEDRTAA